MALGTERARRHGVSRREFFAGAAGMAAAFLVMNDVYGAVFHVGESEATTPELAEERAAALRGQFVFDGHTHFLRDDTRLLGFAGILPLRSAADDLAARKDQYVRAGGERTNRRYGFVAV
jgi:hypothetical protein